MTLCFVNYHRFHFGLISRDRVFEEFGVVHGTELFVIKQPDCTFFYLVLIRIYQLNKDNHSAVELVNLQDMQNKLEVGV